MNIRKVAGIGCIVFGLLNIIDLGSPLIPTMGPSAIVAGLIFIAGGAFLLRAGAGPRPGLLSSIFRGLREERRAKLPAIDPLLPVRTLKLAQERRGALTVSALAMTLEISLDEAQAALDELVRKGAANAEIDLGTGIATYRFPEFQPEAPKQGGEG